MIRTKYPVSKEWKVPECVTEVCSFLGFASYYRRFIPEFAAIATPLTQLTRKHSRFKWDSKCQEAFKLLIDKLTTAPVGQAHSGYRRQCCSH